MDWKTLVIALIAISLVIAVLMETLKRFWKKQKTDIRTWVQIALPGALSILLSWVVWKSLTLPGTWEILIAYSLAVFLGQYYLSMEVMKRVGKVVVKWFMRSKGMTPQEIEEAMGE